jgi:hypothetical protein
MVIDKILPDEVMFFLFPDFRDFKSDARPHKILFWKLSTLHAHSFLNCLNNSLSSHIQNGIFIKQALGVSLVFKNKGSFVQTNFTSLLIKAKPLLHLMDVKHFANEERRESYYVCRCNWIDQASQLSPRLSKILVFKILTLTRAYGDQFKSVGGEVCLFHKYIKFASGITMTLQSFLWWY